MIRFYFHTYGEAQAYFEQNRNIMVHVAKDPKGFEGMHWYCESL